MRLTEPGADLAIAVAIASAISDRPVSHELTAFGEISLAGEIRPVSAARQRASEARRLGFAQVLDAEVGSVRAALDRLRMAAGAPVVDLAAAAKRRAAQREEWDRDVDRSF